MPERIREFETGLKLHRRKDGIIDMSFDMHFDVSDLEALIEAAKGDNIVVRVGVEMSPSDAKGIAAALDSL